MKFLLDTHSFIWYMFGDSRFPAWLRENIEQKENAVFVSIVSIWEMGCFPKRGNDFAQNCQKIASESRNFGRIVASFPSRHSRNQKCWRERKRNIRR
jgi:predicted nucleic acid-binding protein